MKIIECVPNFSEGRDIRVIEQIASSIRSVPAVKLLDIDSGFDANRTVMTFAGEPNSVMEAAFKAIKKASELIDMRQHTGVHPRIGAVDVCPLIPISGITLDEIIPLTEQLSQKVANELVIPTYLYAHSATIPERKQLSWLRKGQYENLETRLRNPDFKPDYGTSVFNPKSGICIIGARPFMIAFNINLDTLNIDIAMTIAEEIRESGTNGRSGYFKNLKAIGWYVEDYKKVQVTMNIMDYLTTPLYEIYEKVRELAAEKGVEVTGSELVGMVPLHALIVCGEYVLKQNHKPHHLSQHELVEYASKYLNMSDVKEFNLNKKVLEFAMNS